jgi:hypothetical protein
VKKQKKKDEGFLKSRKKIILTYSLRIGKRSGSNQGFGRGSSLQTLAWGAALVVLHDW